MNTMRIYAVVKRHMLLTFRSFDRLSNIIYWPLISIVTWGIAGLWMEGKSQSMEAVAALLIGVSFWQVVVRVHVETAKGVLEELFSQNLVNLFATPITFFEWVVAILILGLINMFAVLASTALMVYLLFGLNIFMIGWMAVPLAISFLISGWVTGLFMSGLFIYWGMSVFEVLFMLVWAFAPFCAIYYPVSILPAWVQSVSKFLPMTYAFESMRAVIFAGPNIINNLLMSFGLNFIYFILMLFFFKYMFEKSKKRGLARLT